MPSTPLYIPDLVNRGKFTDYRDPIWGDSYNWSWVRKWEEVKYLVIHHTVTSHDATPDDIALLHKARGWGGIGYHFVITKDGMVWYVGDISTARANVLNKNEQVIGITLVGDFTKHLPSDEQILSAHDLCKFFLFNVPALPNVNGWEDVVGHKELQATACPGNDWKDTASSLYQRIKNRIPYTPAPTPTPDPTPEPTPQPQPEYSIETQVKEQSFSHENGIGTVKQSVDISAKLGGDVKKTVNRLFSHTFNLPKLDNPTVPEVIVDPKQVIDFGDHGRMTLEQAIKRISDDVEAVKKYGEVYRQGTEIAQSKNWWWVKYWGWRDLFTKN